MTGENPVYVRLKYDDSIESKRGILSSEVSLLNLIKSVKRYNLIREEEFRIKSRILKAIKELNVSIRKTQSSFPFLKIPQIAKREDVIKKKDFTKENFNKSLELELKEIQERLNSLDQR